MTPFTVTLLAPYGSTQCEPSAASGVSSSATTSPVGSTAYPSGPTNASVADDCSTPNPTVTAEYVAKNAGVYRRTCDTDDFRYWSDGKGKVECGWERDTHRSSWGGPNHSCYASVHFLPLTPPSPAKEEAKAEKPEPAPTEPASGDGEPKCPYHDTELDDNSYTQGYEWGRVEGWNEAADAWRTYLTSQLSTAQAERDAARSELASLRERIAALTTPKGNP